MRTQDRAGENGIPDIRVEADDVDVIVEVKLGGDLTLEQLKVYAKALETERACFALVGLVGRKPNIQLPPHTALRTWGDLGVKLGEEARSSQSDLTRYLIDQFVVLLNHLHLCTLKISSELSKELSAHGQWSEAHPELPSVFRTRIKSIDRLGGMPHLGPLRQLLLQMDRVLSKAKGVKRRRFDSGPNMAEPWIGFNVNDMAYFFYVSLTRPETVWLQRYVRGVAPASFDGSFGALETRTPTAVTSWKAQLDLLEPALAFFSQNEVVQEKYIGDFFERAFAFGENLRPLP